MSFSVHPSAIVEPGAKIGAGVEIGPFCHIGAHVALGDGVRLMSHVVVGGHTRIGARTTVFPFAVLGMAPQHRKYHGEPSRLTIGRECLIREHVTMHPGTEVGVVETVVGDRCLFMVGVHIAHDCRVGDHVVMANNVLLGGHVEVGDYANFGGGAAIHQFVRIGRHAMIGGLSGVENDVIPYGSVIGDRGCLSGLNIIGLKRRGFSREDIHTLRNAYRLLFAQEGNLSERVCDVSELFRDNAPVLDIIEFIKADSSRSICQPRS